MIPLPLKQGQQLSVDSSPVVLASDGALPLPTGAATETTLALIKTAVTGLTADAIAASQESITTSANAVDSLSLLLGWNGATHKEVILDTSGNIVLSTRHETVTTPLATRLSDGTDFITAGAIAASQKTVATATKAIDVVSFILGWDSTTHRELLLDTSGAIRIAAADISSITTGIGKHTAADQVRRDCATANLTASIDTSIIASTTAAKRLSIFNGTGVSMILKVDTVQQMIVPPGGISEDLVIPDGKTLTLNPYTTCTDGEIVINTFA